MYFVVEYNELKLRTKTKLKQKQTKNSTVGAAASSMPMFTRFRSPPLNGHGILINKNIHQTKESIFQRSCVITKVFLTVGGTSYSQSMQILSIEN